MEIKDFWENAHQNNEELWLTGTYFHDVWSSLNILDKLEPGITVLNIGVGLGRDTKELATKKVTIDVLDISQIALNRVKDITRKQYLSQFINTLPINEYDIATSHLVTQHMNDDDLKLQLEYVIRSLKPDGIFAMQFAFIHETPEAQAELNRVYGSVSHIPTDQKGHMFRTLDKMKDMVEKCGGKITWVSDVREYSHTPIKWLFIHMKKK